MKKYLLFGMLTAILAGALILAGCGDAEGGAMGPKGDKGDKGQDLTGGSLTDLADYGFAFGTPVHNSVGRGATYPHAIYSNEDLTITDATTESPTFANTVTIKVGTKSVRYTVAAADTWNDFVGSFATNAAKGGITGVAASLVTSAADSTKKVIKFTVPAGGFTITFGASIAAELGTTKGEFSLAGGTVLTALPTIAARNDVWTVPIVTAAATNFVAHPATVTLGGKTVDITGDDVTFAAADLETKLATAFTGAAAAVSGYTVAALGATTYTGSGLVFTKANAASTNVSADFIPAITGFSSFGDYGYIVKAVHTTPGAAQVPASGSDVYQIHKMGAGNSAIAKGDYLTIKSGDNWDTTVFPGVINANALADTDIFQSNTSASVGVAAALGVVTLTAKQYAANYITTAQSASVGAFSTTMGGSAATALVAAKSDTWTITVYTASNTGTDKLIPTKTSRIAFATPFVTAAKTALIYAGDNGGAIATAIQAALASNLGTANYTVNSVGGNSFTISAAAGATPSPALTLTDSNFAPVAQYQ